MKLLGEQQGCVAFRLDDIQDYYLSNIQTAIIDLFSQEEIKLTLGVIGNAFGNDSVLVENIRKSIRQKESSPIRIANHGWNHEDLTKHNKCEQSSLIRLCNEKIHRILNIYPSVFIPPFNLMDGNTLLALQENNMQFVSGSIECDPPPYIPQASPPYHFPVTDFTGDVLFNIYWYKLKNSNIIKNIYKSIAKHGFSVIGLHPQVYSTRHFFRYENNINRQRLIELRLLLNKIRNGSLTVVAIEEIKQFLSSSYSK